MSISRSSLFGCGNGRGLETEYEHTNHYQHERHQVEYCELEGGREGGEREGERERERGREGRREGREREGGREGEREKEKVHSF